MDQNRRCLVTALSTMVPSSWNCSERGTRLGEQFSSQVPSICGFFVICSWPTQGERVEGQGLRREAAHISASALGRLEPRGEATLQERLGNMG